MRSIWPIVFLGAIVLVAVGVSIWATRVLLQQQELPRVQRLFQLVLVWIVPIIGALLILEMYRPSRTRRAPGTVTADDIHPVLNQALQPLADGATRAATGFIEQEAFDSVVDHITHSGGEGSH